jgi:hypothetical protein
VFVAVVACFFRIFEGEPFDVVVVGIGVAAVECVDDVGGTGEDDEVADVGAVAAENLLFCYDGDEQRSVVVDGNR